MYFSFKRGWSKMTARGRCQPGLDRLAEERTSTRFKSTVVPANQGHPCFSPSFLYPSLSTPLPSSSLSPFLSPSPSPSHVPSPPVASLLVLLLYRRLCSLSPPVLCVRVKKAQTPRETKKNVLVFLFDSE